MEITYGDQVNLDTGVYSVQASVDDDMLTVELLGADENGEVQVEGRFRLPTAAIADAHFVLRTVFDGAQHLNLRRPEPTAKQQRDLPANNGQPWTEEADQRLTADWLRASPEVKAAGLVKELRRQRERTPGSIRSRLLRLGLDADHAGHRLASDPGPNETEVEEIAVDY